MQFKEVIQEVVRDKVLFGVWIVFFVLTLAYIVLVIMRIAPSDLQIPVRYSSFGVTNFYRDKWFYLLGFAAIGAVIFLLHSSLTLKLYVRKGRELALPFLLFGVGVILIAALIVFALFRVVVLSQ